MCIETKEVHPENGTDFSLEELRKLIDCEYIEVLGINNDMIMIIDEEGKLNKKTFNLAATQICHEYHSILTWDCVVGKVVLCPRSMLK